ncbi:MAG: hypothetical protein ACLSH3_14725 [Alistipes finegoldii]
MERIRQEAERFRRHDEAVARSSEEFRRSLRVGDILYSSWGWEQTNIDFYQVIAIRGSAVDLRQLDQRTTEDGYMCGTTVPLPDVFKGKRRTYGGLVRCDAGLRHDTPRGKCRLYQGLAGGVP